MTLALALILYALGILYLAYEFAVAPVRENAALPPPHSLPRLRDKAGCEGADGVGGQIHNAAQHIETGVRNNG
jgi:hypothetical protein